MGPKSNYKCLYRRQKKRRQIGKRGHVKTGRDWNHAATSQRSLEHQKLEEAKNTFFPKAFKGNKAP